MFDLIIVVKGGKDICPLIRNYILDSICGRLVIRKSFYGKGRREVGKKLLGIGDKFCSGSEFGAV